MQGSTGTHKLNIKNGGDHKWPAKTALVQISPKESFLADGSFAVHVGENEI